MTKSELKNLSTLCMNEDYWEIAFAMKKKARRQLMGYIIKNLCRYPLQQKKFYYDTIIEFETFLPFGLCISFYYRLDEFYPLGYDPEVYITWTVNGNEWCLEMHPYYAYIRYNENFVEFVIRKKLKSILKL